MADWSAARPKLAQSYGIDFEPEGLLTWEWVEERLVASRNYWIATSRADGRAHTKPHWGMWVDSLLYWGTDPHSITAGNLRRDNRATVHLESGDEVVIMEGVVIPGVGDANRERLADLSQAKYDFKPAVSEFDIYMRFEPQVVLAWREIDFPSSATRLVKG